MKPDSAPENLHHGVVVMVVKIGFWKFVQAGSTNDSLIFEELIAAANTEMRKEKGNKIIKN